MITRLRVRGFKNLADAEVRFGPFTCIAGLNGVGKSNLFDAIQFLALLADRPFIEAASEVRGGRDDVTKLFTVGGDGLMAFECDVLIDKVGHDDFNQPAEASHTFLRYKLVLQLVEDGLGLPRIRLHEEALDYIPKSEAKVALGFAYTDDWFDAALPTSHRRVPFIRTDRQDDRVVVSLRADDMRDPAKPRRGGGRPSEFDAERTPRTVLSSAHHADEARTVVLLRQQMRTWRTLQLEPSALRTHDDFQSPPHIDLHGAHVPATLFRLTAETPADQIYAEVSNRLAELVDDVRNVRIDRDDARRTFRLMLQDRQGVELPASSLSDGTLRFVALAVMDLDPRATGVLCFEEPENGIHPERLGAMMRLLGDMAVDPNEPIGQQNPLRQVIVSTHSPVVAAAIAPGDLVFAEAQEYPGPNGRRMRTVAFKGIQASWRTRLGAPAVGMGKVLSYLGAINSVAQDLRPARLAPRVADFSSQLPLPFPNDQAQ